MKILRWLALVSSVLIVGVLIAPVPSEAVPSLKITTFADGDITIPFTSLTGTCSLSDRNAGYTACYPIATNTYGTLDQWSIQSVSSTNPARLLIADTTGAGNSLDLFTLTGVKFQPVFSGFEQLTVTFQNTFDTAPNPAGNYLFAMRTGGYFVAGNTNGDNTDIGNEVNLSGTGEFGFGPQFLGSLDTGSIGGPSSIAVFFSFSQPQQYQSNNCDNGSSLCTPTITQTLVFNVWNRDTLFLTNSADGAGGNCDVRPPTNVPPGPPTGLPPGPSSPCKAKSGKINSFFNQADSADSQAAREAGAVPFTPCETYTCGPPVVIP